MRSELTRAELNRIAAREEMGKKVAAILNDKNDTNLTEILTRIKTLRVTATISTGLYKSPPTELAQRVWSESKAEPDAFLEKLNQEWEKFPKLYLIWVFKWEGDEICTIYDHPYSIDNWSINL